jgi:hypothetical protein
LGAFPVYLNDTFQCIAPAAMFLRLGHCTVKTA